MQIHRLKRSQTENELSSIFSGTNPLSAVISVSEVGALFLLGIAQI
jgi:hypothetical protein